jgi:hypothetical protein
MPPASSAPRVVALAAQPHPVFENRDMIGNILRQLLMSTHDPRQVCKGVVALRGLSRSLRGDDTNLYKLGCEALRIPPQRDATHEYRFKQACRELRKFMAQPLDERTLHLDPEDPGYRAFGWYYATMVYQQPDALRFVPRTRPEFPRVAEMAVQVHGAALRHVPDDLRPALARLAVTTTPTALEWVRPEDHPDDYSEVARLAVSADWRAFQYVPKTHPAFGDIARVAVTADVRAIFEVPEDHPELGGLMRIAVQQNARSIHHLPTTHPEYCDIALLAVRSDAQKGSALAFCELQPSSCSEEQYADMARIALAVEGSAFQYVPTGHPSYVELAKIALEQNPLALIYVHPEHPNYVEIAKFAIKRDPEAFLHVKPERTVWGDHQEGCSMDAYYDIVRFAIAEDPMLIDTWFIKNGSYIPSNVYGELARLAVERDRSAYQYVRKDHPVHAELRRTSPRRRV